MTTIPLTQLALYDQLLRLCEVSATISDPALVQHSHALFRAIQQKIRETPRDSEIYYRLRLCRDWDSVRQVVAGKSETLAEARQYCEVVEFLEDEMATVLDTVGWSEQHQAALDATREELQRRARLIRACELTQFLLDTARVEPIDNVIRMLQDNVRLLELLKQHGSAQ